MCIRDSYDSAAREFELITIWPYDDDTQLPGGKLVPRAGDTYIPVSYTHLIHALEKQLDELRGKLKLLQEESESVQVTPADVPNAQRQFNGLHITWVE